MTEKEKDILDKAEDVILKKIKLYQEAPEAMTDKDCYNLQLLVITVGRIQGIRDGWVNMVHPC